MNRLEVKLTSNLKHPFFGDRLSSTVYEDIPNHVNVLSLKHWRYSTDIVFLLKSVQGITHLPVFLSPICQRYPRIPQVLRRFLRFLTDLIVNIFLQIQPKSHDRCSNDLEVLHSSLGKNVH